MTFNTVVHQFFSNDGGYIEGDSVIDSIKGWETPTELSDAREEDNVVFLESLTDMYDLIGPKEWVGRTVPKYVPVDAEVGDDHLGLNDSPLIFVAEVVTAKDTCGISVSKKDTFISSRYGNYSENYILKPDNISEIYSPNMKSGQDSVFLDVVKIRTVLPVSSMRQKHSDTVDGKVTLLGKQSLYRTELCGREITIGQSIQFVTLGLAKERKFPYAPTFLGGFGSPPIFDNTKSMLRCFETYKNGTYYNVLASMCLAVFNVSNGGHPGSIEFLKQVRGYSEAWQDWYKASSKYVPQIKGSVDPEVYRDHYLGTLGKDEIWDSAATRLIAAGALSSKTQILVHQHMEDLTRVLLSSENSLATREAIEQERIQQRQSSIFDPKILKEVPLELPLFLEDRLVSSLLSLSAGMNYHLKAMLSADDVFSVDALDAVKQKSPTKVNIQITTDKGMRLPLRFDAEIREEEVEHYKSLYDFVSGKSTLEEVSRVLIEDDPVLLEIAKEWAMETRHSPLSSINIMVLTTDDTALCKEINFSYPQIVVMRISAKRTPESIQRIKDSLGAVYKTADLRFYDDEGSLANAKASTATLLDKARGSWQRVRFVLGKTIPPHSKHHRRLKETRIVNLVLKPDAVFDQRGLLSDRYNPPRVYKKRTLATYGEVHEEYALDDFS